MTGTWTEGLAAHCIILRGKHDGERLFVDGIGGDKWEGETRVYMQARMMEGSLA